VLVVQILSISMDDNPCSHLAILEAASANTAHLFYLSLDLTLQVEKLLGPQQLPPVAQPHRKSASFQAFQNRTVNAVLASKRPSARLSGGAQLSAGEGSNKAALGNRMWVHSVNPWHSSTSVHSQKQLEKLADRYGILTENFNTKANLNNYILIFFGGFVPTNKIYLYLFHFFLAVLDEICAAIMHLLYGDFLALYKFNNQSVKICTFHEIVNEPQCTIN
jgi:hypothetical protein